MPNIKVKGQAGNVLTFENVERVLFDSADDSESTVPFSYGDVGEIPPIVLDLGSGDQKVTAPDGTLLRSVQIAQPSTLKSENIRKGVSIAGVQGSLINDTEEVTVELNFPMVETDILPEQTVEFDDYGMAATNSIGLVEGEKYFVVWGGTEYVATGMLLESPNLTGVYIGNLSLSGEGDVTDYPFLIGDSGVNTYIFSGDISSPDTIRVYQKIGDGIPDQVVLPSDEEKAMSKVTIKKPETLVPSNIANGVEIGGVTGKFIGDTEEVTVELNFQEYTPETDILSECVITTTVIHLYGVYGYGVPWGGSFKVFPLDVGEKCIVVWDDVEYEVTVGDANAVIADRLYMGNGSSVGLSGNNEPFCIFWDQVEGVTIFVPADTAPNRYTIRIYQKAIGGSPDQIVLPSEEGKVLSKVTIIKPETLVPANIAEGVSIAGVEGSYKGASTEPHIVYTLNEDGEPIAAKMIGFTTIPTGCFAYMQSLVSVDLSESPNITSIDDQAFNACKSLTSIIIPDSVTYIGLQAFYNCSSLTSITIPDSVTYIGSNGIRGCTELTNVTIGNSVTYIGSGAFQSCSKLTSIIIPDSVTYIGSYAFSGCSALTSITLEDQSGWYVSTTATATSGSSMTVSDPGANAINFTSAMAKYHWFDPT